MRKFIIIITVLLFFTGCSRKEQLEFPGEDNIQPYIQKILEIGELPDYEYLPSIDDFFITTFKTGLFIDDLKYLESSMSSEGMLADENCTIYLPIATLASFCDGKTRLYIDGNLKKEFDSVDNMGNSYLLLSNALSDKIGQYISRQTWSSESIRGKKIYTRFYMTEEDWVNAVTDKDPFKNLRLDVIIK